MPRLGIMVDGMNLFELQLLIESMAAADVDKPGIMSGDNRSGSANTFQSQKDSVKNGIITGEHDPELAAFFSMVIL